MTKLDLRTRIDLITAKLGSKEYLVRKVLIEDAKLRGEPWTMKGKGHLPQQKVEYRATAEVPKMDFGDCN